MCALQGLWPSAELLICSPQFAASPTALKSHLLNVHMVGQVATLREIRGEQRSMSVFK